MAGVQARVQARSARLKESAIVDRLATNAAHLLESSESFSNDRLRVEALVGVVSDALFSSIQCKFRNFMHKLRKMESDSVKSGAATRDSFYVTQFSPFEVFGDASLSFLTKPSSIALSVCDGEISSLLAKGLSSFAKCCVTLPSPPISPIVQPSVSKKRWMRTRALNCSKRKTISDLRAKITSLHYTIALLKRKGTPTSNAPSGNRKETNELRRELEAALLETNSLRDRLAALQHEHKIVTKENGKFTSDFHHLIIKLMSIGIPDSKISQVIRDVSFFVGREISDYPSLSTIRNDASAILALTILQTREVVDEVIGGNDLTLISDETTKRRHKMQAYLVSVDRDEEGSKVFCLGIMEVHCKTAQESLLALKARLNRVELVTSGTVTGEFLRNFVTSLSSSMSDRAATQLKFNRLLEDFKREIMPFLRDDWENLTDSERKSLSAVHTLYCQLHIAASVTDVFMRVMGEMEGLSGEDCTLLWVLKTCASHFSDRGSGKFMQISKWIVFLNDKGVDSAHCILPSFDGQRFCIAFAIAARVYYLREYLIEYISRYNSDNDTLCKARDALSSPLIISQLRTASLVDSFVTAPLIRLSEHTRHVLDTSTYIGELISYLEDCESAPARMTIPPIITIGDPTSWFKLDSPYLKVTVASALLPDDLRCISLVSSEIRLFLDVQYADYLPGGCYHSPSQSLVDSLKNAPSTSRSAERAFGIVDYLFTKSPNCRMLRREALAMSRMNDTMKWVDGMPLEVKASVLQSALGMRKQLEGVSGEERVQLAQKIRDGLVEKEEEIKRKQQREFQRQSTLATVIATEIGYWRTVDAMDQALSGMSRKGEKIKALTHQIQYRKSTLKQPAPRPGIFVIRPKGVPVTEERLRGVVEELIEADLAASSGKRVAPNWKGRRVERVVRNTEGFYTVVEGMIEEIEDFGGVLYVKIVYDPSEADTILLEELEEEIESGNAKFLGNIRKK